MPRITYEVEPYTPDSEIRVKWEVIRAIEKICARNGYDQKKIARILGTSEAQVSRLLNKRFQNISLKVMFRYLSILYPKFRILISLN